jgi:hypothetical protein
MISRFEGRDLIAQRSLLACVRLTHAIASQKKREGWGIRRTIASKAPIPNIGGGGRSHERTRLTSNFRVTGKFTGNLPAIKGYFGTRLPEEPPQPCISAPFITLGSNSEQGFCDKAAGNRRKTGRSAYALAVIGTKIDRRSRSRMSIGRRGPGTQLRYHHKHSSHKQDLDH